MIPPRINLSLFLVPLPEFSQFGHGPVLCGALQPEELFKGPLPMNTEDMPSHLILQTILVEIVARTLRVDVPLIPSG